MNDRHTPANYVGPLELLNPSKFAQCTSCFTPMLGICDSDLRKDCYHCVEAEKLFYGDCKGL